MIDPSPELPDDTPQCDWLPERDALQSIVRPEGFIGWP